MEPLPNCFQFVARATANAFCLFSSIAIITPVCSGIEPDGEFVLLKQLYCMLIRYPSVFVELLPRGFVARASSLSTHRFTVAGEHSRRVIPSPLTLAKANHTVPTGFSSLPPSGPAIPLIATAKSARAAFNAQPRSPFQTTTGSLTAPCCARSLHARQSSALWLHYYR